MPRSRPTRVTAGYVVDRQSDWDLQDGMGDVGPSDKCDGEPPRAPQADLSRSSAKSIRRDRQMLVEIDSMTALVEKTGMRIACLVFAIAAGGVSAAGISPGIAGAGGQVAWQSLVWQLGRSA